MGNFIHENLVTKLHLTCTPQRPLLLMDVKGLKIGSLEFQVKLTMRIGSHEEHLVLDVVPIGLHWLILGLPWLEAHDPTIHWSTGHFQFNSPHCNLHCLPQPHDIFAKSPVIAATNLEAKIPVMRNTPDAQLPTCGLPDSAGWDLYSMENTMIPIGQRALVDTGVTMQLPPGTYGRIAPWSGLAWKQGITMGAGVIDQDYTGSIKALLFNHGEHPVTITKGDRVAQLIPEQYNNKPLWEVDLILSTECGMESFGSTGVNTMEPDLVEIFAIDLMPTATEDEIKNMIPVDYHDMLSEGLLPFLDPEGPLRGMPPERTHNFEIKLNETKPLLKPGQPYHMSPGECEDWIKWQDTMMKGGLILQAPACTLIAAPFFFVWRKDGTRQPVINYRKLNNITVKDSYPLPHINETLEHMQGAKFFLKFNLKMGYNQLHIKPEDCWKTTFMMPNRPYMMNVMTFGFANAPAYFQQWMSDILQPVVGQCVENYLDDMATHHATMMEHVTTNRMVLKCFQDASVYLNLKKCKFHQEQMGFLGVEVSAKGFEMEKLKVDTIENWRPQKTVQGVREFTGFCNFYHRFIKSFSEIARPLHDLTKVGQWWMWGDNEQHAFDTLKRMVCEMPVLIHVDPDKRFQMETDASSYAYRAVLSQKGMDNKHHPVAFFSKSMNPAKRNYSISDKEALTIIKALVHWRHLLEGTWDPIQIITNH